MYTYDCIVSFACGWAYQITVKNEHIHTKIAILIQVQVVLIHFKPGRHRPKLARTWFLEISLVQTSVYVCVCVCVCVCPPPGYEKPFTLNET